MGLSSTTDKQKEAAWRAEFEALGEQLVFAKQGAMYNDEASVRRRFVGFPNGTGPPSLHGGRFLWLLRGCLSASLAY
jgi:hypothetical protein